MDHDVLAALCLTPLMMDLLRLLCRWELAVAGSRSWSERKAELRRNFQTRSLCHRVKFYHGSAKDGEYCAKCVENTVGPYIKYELHILRGLDLPDVYSCRNCHELLTALSLRKCGKCVVTFEEYMKAERRIKYPADRLNK